MKSFICLLSILICVYGQDLRFACKDGKFLPTAELNAKLGACHNPDLYGEGKKNPNCAAFCFTEAIGTLTNGVPDKAAFEKLVDTEFPESEKATAKEHVNFCFDQHKTFDTKDENCVDIAAFSACGTNLVSKTKCPAV